ncbi:MAG: HPr family phosphocarrier protein [Chlamydiota bacterium]
MKSKNRLKKSFVILNDKGLHARPATELVRCASSFESRVFLGYRGFNANAKSILSILMLAATRGASIQLEAEGVDAEAAVTAIIKLANNKFNIDY